MQQVQKRDPWFRNHLIRDGIGLAIYDQMKLDPSIYLFGEGAHMKVHFDAPPIEKEFSNRVITLPISEDGNTNFAVGASLLGVKPVVDVITADFLYRTLDSICNTAAKINFVTADADFPRTIVIRAEFLVGGPTTGQRLEGIFTHIPGINVALPSAPNDARGLMTTALTRPGVTVYFEDRMIKDAETKPVDKDGGKSVGVPFGKARLRKAGKRLTIVSYALTLRQVEVLVDRNEIDCDLIDPRTLYPMDYDAICKSVDKTGALLVVEPDVAYSGVGAEIAASVTERCFSAMRKPARRLGAPRSTIPASQGLHEFMLPSDGQILNAIEELSA
jgi:pyruvate dehydrogenase E1 component beta subunit